MITPSGSLRRCGGPLGSTVPSHDKYGTESRPLPAGRPPRPAELVAKRRARETHFLERATAESQRGAESAPVDRKKLTLRRSNCRAGHVFRVARAGGRGGGGGHDATGAPRGDVPVSTIGHGAPAAVALVCLQCQGRRRGPSWQHAAPLSAPRSEVGAALAGRIFVVGGSPGRRVLLQDRAYRGDDRWRRRRTYRTTHHPATPGTADSCRLRGYGGNGSLSPRLRAGDRRGRRFPPACAGAAAEPRS